MFSCRSLVAAAAALLLAAGLPDPASARIEKKSIRVGILNDMSGPYADLGGPGSVVAAQMAAEDVGGSIGDAKIEILSADHQNKPDVGSAMVRRWIDQEGVDAIADVPVSSVALAVQEIARQAKRITLMQATTSDLTGKACSPYSFAWQDDTYSISRATSQSVVAAGGKSWFFVAADYAFGQALERDAGAAIRESGGAIAGSVRHPLNAGDMSSFLLQAQSSKAQVIGLLNGGSDLINSIKQAQEFGLTQRGQKIATFLLYLTDVHSLGLAATKGLLMSEGFYWNQNETARAWSQRYFQRTKRMPTKEHASVYSSLIHYFKAVKAADSLDADAVAAEMRRLPVDHFGHAGSVRADGRVLYPITLYEVKDPSESKEPWDYYKQVGTVSADKAFKTLAEGGCPLIK